MSFLLWSKSVSLMLVRILTVFTFPTSFMLFSLYYRSKSLDLSIVITNFSRCLSHSTYVSFLNNFLREQLTFCNTTITGMALA